MKEVVLNQCDFCFERSFNKSDIRQHEKSCYHNPLTHSCPTCFWNSRKYVNGPIECFVGKLLPFKKGQEVKYKKRCSKWVHLFHSAVMDKIVAARLLEYFMAVRPVEDHRTGMVRIEG